MVKEIIKAAHHDDEQSSFCNWIDISRTGENLNWASCCI